MRKLWTDFQAGMRPRWDFGRIDKDQVQLGFEELTNVILEGGTIRKRKGIINSGVTDTGIPITAHDAFPFSNGVGERVWQASSLFYFANFFGISSQPVKKVLSMPSPVGRLAWGLNDVVSFIDTNGAKQSAVLNPDDTFSTSTTEFGIIAEAGGRRFFFDNVGEPGFVLTSFSAGIAIVNIILDKSLVPGFQIVLSDTTNKISINHDPNGCVFRVVPNELGGVGFQDNTTWVAWWVRNFIVYPVALILAFGSRYKATSSNDTQVGHTVTQISSQAKFISVRGSRSAQRKTMTFSATLITGNSVLVTINNVVIGSTVWATSSDATFAAIVSAINAKAEMIAAGISATFTSPKTITFVGLVDTATMVVTSGVSQATVAPIVDSLRDFNYSDGSGAVLLDADPIILNLRGYGFVRWVAWGGGLFMGTSKGVYEIVSGLGPGFAPSPGGFYPQEVSNIGVFQSKHSTSYALFQGSVITKNSVAYLSGVDMVSVLNRYKKTSRQIKLDVPVTHAIDSFAYFGGTKIAVLCAKVANRALWSTVSGYDTSENFIYILDEDDGAITKFPIPALSIFGLDGLGMMVKYMKANTPQVGFIPWLANEKYMTSPQTEGLTGQDVSLFGAANITARIVTMPIHLQSGTYFASYRDLGDSRKLTSMALRVKEAYSLMFGQKGLPLRAWTQADAEYSVALPALYSGDIVGQVDGNNYSQVQIQIEDSSIYPFEVLAIQANLDVQTQEGGTA